MVEKIYKTKRFLYFIIITFTLLTNFFIASFFFNQNLFDYDQNNEKNSNYDVAPKSQGIIQELHTVEWLDNPTFETPIAPWYNTTQGDDTDVNFSTTQAQANYIINGEKFKKEIILNSTTQSEWRAFNRTELVILPNLGYGDGDGAYLGHDWNEDSGGQPYNTPRMHWRINVSMPDMSDYIITSASFNAVINATVNQDIDTPGDTQARWGPDRALNQWVIYDYAQFYVEISDLDINELNTYRIAFNQTRTLGNDGPPTTNYEMEEFIDTKTMQAVIDAINNVLAVDPGHNNFTIVLGIYIYSEDNYGGNDRDQWEDLRFKSLNLTFTYEKKIDQNTEASWNQVGNKISGSNIDIINATLNFKYKIDKNWTIFSPNSEFRVYINNRIHTETVKLSSTKTSFQDIKVGGFDVTGLILKDINISLSIQVYLADTFALNQTFVVSIDNASLLISYTENIVETETKLDLLLESINKTLEKSIEVTMGNPVNITAIYKDQANNFIQNATVQLEGLGAPKDLMENSSLEQYNITIHTSNLQIGNNFLTISANKIYYESIEILINIKVIERQTDLQLFLDKNNKTLDKSIQMMYGNSGNITVTYKDKENYPYTHINNATVELTGYGNPTNLTEDILFEQYYIFIDTSILGLGNVYLTLTANKENYTAQYIRFKIEVLERNSYIDKVFLNQTESLGIEIQWNETLNIAITYNDTATNTFIDNALVQLTGTGISKNFTENNPLNYSLNINTRELQLGINFLTISTQKENYTLSSRIITITVLKRSTSLQTFLNQTGAIGIEIPWNEILNIAIIYNDASTSAFINNAIVQLTGTGISENFTENSPLNYSLDINTKAFNLGANILTISAKKDNYTLSSRTITISVLERTTYFEIFINNSKYSTSQFYNSSIGEFLNVTVFYRDFKTNALIDSAVVQLIESGNIDNLTENLLFNFYEIIIEMEPIGAGVKFLTVSAKRDNYTLFSEVISLIIREKQTEIQLFLNGTQYFDGETIELEVTDILNITVKYFDNITSTSLNGATIDLIDSGQFDENPIQEYYNITIAVFDLGETLNRLSIIAQLNNYQTALIEFFIQVVERKSEGTLILNQVNKTADPYLELPIGRLLNITVEFLDSKTGNYISGATIQLDGDLKDVLIENSTFGQYSLIIDTSQLSLGLNIFTIIAERANFQLFTIQKMYINIRRISTNVTFSGNTTISIKLGESASLEVILYNLDFGGTIILGANLTYRWQFIDGTLTDPNNDGVYEATTQDITQVGTYIVTIYAFLGENYDFAPLEIVISVVREPTPDPSVFIGLLIAVSIGAAVLIGYIIAYQRVLKFPKAVRKTRKYRRTLKRKSAPSVHIIGRESAFKSHYNKNLGIFTSGLKLKRHSGMKKPMKQKITPDKPLEHKMEPDQLSEKVIEKKGELDELIKDPSK
ncbi:hypothetical protein LCGC14_0801170 [marine sediment metagenome]|uniref:Uncharacterized protein n=1 Tax=marine sediment metagenome TaxID=412755 RepID=A0A0F9PPH7_9ZZZZ